MKTLSISTKAAKETAYSIFIGKNILQDINKIIHLNNYAKAVVITDKNLESNFLPAIMDALPLQAFSSIIIEPGETEKNIETVQMIWKKLLETGCDRKSLVI